MRRGRGGRGLFHANPKLLLWREAVALHARQAVGGKKVLSGALACSMMFYLERPKSPLCLNYPIGPPDLDKLIRAIGDACKGIVWEDDARIVHIEAKKLWGEPRAEVLVWEADPPLT